MPKLDLALAGLLVITIVAVVVPLHRRRDPDRDPDADAMAAERSEGAEDAGFDDL